MLVHAKKKLSIFINILQNCNSTADVKLVYGDLDANA